MNRNNIFLTENRRDVLAGESDYSAGALANEKSRIRTLAREAIKELIEVARSEEIENPDVFDADRLGVLLFHVLNDRATEDYDPTQGGAHVPEGVETPAPEETVVRIPKELAEYQQAVYTEVDGPLRSIRPPAGGRYDG